MNIGKNPTFTDKNQSIEVHFFDLDYDIYDKTITIKLIKRIRDEKKFNSPELLREQLELDKDFSVKVEDLKSYYCNWFKDFPRWPYHEKLA